MSRISLGADIGGSHLTCRQCDLDRNRFFSEKNRKNKITALVLVSELQENTALAGSDCLCDDRFYSKLNLLTP